ncbi:DEKNAAC102861 [Brettanomyces naardenensis]|uniref:DEKNAAC102861 n=1 Tax=Brettanomyces naardenensis TaxID=13370 RepID=A0A448YLZ5_BRENA|nr:DEKNAAC102861 [Brettanomyces naardenensis]
MSTSESASNTPDPAAESTGSFPSPATNTSFSSHKHSNVPPGLPNRSSLFFGVPSGDADETIHSKDSESPILASNSTGSDEKPPLPPRNRSAQLQVDIPERFGLDRLAGQEFEKAENSSPIVGRHGFENFARNEEPEPENGQNFHDRTLNHLLNKRKIETEEAYEELPDNLKVSSEKYYEMVHSNDSYVELLSEIQSGSYDNPDKEMLYSLLSGSLKVSDDFDSLKGGDLDRVVFSDSVKKLPLPEGSDKDAIVDDLLKIYSIVGCKSPHPLIGQLHGKIASIRTCLMLALILNKVVNGSQKFQFVLLRTIESRFPDFVIKQYNSGNISFPIIEQIVDSDDVWFDLIQKVNKAGLVESLVHICVVYGFYGLIDTLAFCIANGDAPLSSIEVSSDLCRFEREYTIINQNSDQLSNGETIAKEKRKCQYFTEDLQKKKEKYNDLLNNYKQLNEERFSDETVLKKLTYENEELKRENASKERELAGKLSSFDVIKVNNDKNVEISKMNEDLRKEIARLTLDIDEMKSKLKK